MVDGGWLLHQVKWFSGASVKTIVDTYVRYVQAKFKDSNVVFDGYGEEPSRKDHEHMRRMSRKKVSPDLRVAQVFPANDKNKAALIGIIST